MGYISKITIGGESYSLAPEVVENGEIANLPVLGDAIFYANSSRYYFNPLEVVYGKIAFRLDYTSSRPVYVVDGGGYFHQVPGISVGPNGGLFPYFLISSAASGFQPDSCIATMCYNNSGAIGLYVPTRNPGLIVDNNGALALNIDDSVGITLASGEKICLGFDSDENTLKLKLTTE